MKRKELSSFSPIQSCSEVQFTAGPEYHVATHNHTSTQVFARTNTQQRIYYHGDATFVLSADGLVMAVRGTMGVPIISTPSMTIVRAVPWESRPGKIALSANGQYLYVRANFSAEAAIFRLEDGSKLPAISLDGSETEEQFYTDNRTEEVRLVAGTQGGSIKIWDIFSGSLYKELSDSSKEASPVCSVSVTENFSCGILVASLDAGGLVRLWDIDTGTCLLKLGVGMDFIFSGMSGGRGHYFVTVSPDGLRLLVRRRELTAICMLHGLANALTKPKEVSET
ncbi:hypothetical protein CPB84DRAFT_987788 [Gymnopilus junonius]|uniref:Uncharacterized protein n=1 Tax=Gymnopilus junonius TaxID=109634 RepID=A0A9P5TNN3_GYMJU|nr:hypothetical protein CPB84DRAFT_987788 [Gymnopilus junonius]